MPTPTICLAARGVVRDAETNAISVYSILERIVPAGLPLVIQEMFVFVLWHRQPNDPPIVETRFRALNNDRPVIEAPVQINFGVDAAHRSIVTLGGLVLQEPGQLNLVFDVNGVEIARYIIDVLPPPARAAVPGGQPPAPVSVPAV